MNGELLFRLPSCWRVLGDTVRDTVVLLHDDGLWAEATAEAVLLEYDAHSIYVLTQAFATALAEGRTGKHAVWSRSEEGRCVEARLVSMAEAGPTCRVGQGGTEGVELCAPDPNRGTPWVGGPDVARGVAGV